MDKRKTRRMGIRLSALGGVLLIGSFLFATNLHTAPILVVVMTYILFFGLPSLAAGLVLLVVSGCMKDEN